MSSFCTTAMLLKFRELAVYAHPNRTTPTLSCMEVMIFVFKKLKQAFSTVSMELIPASLCGLGLECMLA